MSDFQVGDRVSVEGVVSGIEWVDFDNAPEYVGVDLPGLGETTFRVDQITLVERPRRKLRISRPCYDKPHRCPGWAGGGLEYAKVSRCDDGGPIDPYNRLWQVRFHRCSGCRVVILPYAIHYLDWRWLDYRLRSYWDAIQYRMGWGRWSR